MAQDMLDAISSQIRRAPKAAALQTGGRIYSFGALGRRVQGIYDALAETAGRGLVLIAGHKEADAVAAMLACMFLGRAFAFIDRSNPPGRAADILRLSKADLVLTAGSGGAIPGARSLALSQIADRPFDLRPAAVPDSDLLYVVFTSGSTGTPKGVPCGRDNFAAFDAWYRHMLADLPGQALDPAQSAHVNHASLAFDMGMLDLWPVLALGRPVILLDHGDNVIPRNNIKALTRSDLVQARSWFSTPSLLQIMAMDPKFNGDTLPAMRCFFVGGEIVPRELLQTLAARFPQAEIRHAYGPTETTCLSHVHSLTAADLAGSGLLPLGPALGAFAMRILDEEDRDVAPGEVGEVVLSGPQVVRGYLPADHPANRAFATLNGVAIYRTGDFGKRDANGSLTLLGRIDRQVKWNGNRIELDEIERAAYRTKGVQKAACIPVKEDNRVVDILLLVQPETGATLTTQAVAEVLLAALPATMVPRDIRVVASLPVTVNGKLDSKALLKTHLAPVAETA